RTRGARAPRDGVELPRAAAPRGLSGSVPIASFRELVAWLDERGELARVTRSVDPKHELVAVLRKTQQGPNVALLFENVKGSPMPVASNVMARRTSIAGALGIPVADLLPELAARESRALEPQTAAEAEVRPLRAAVVIGAPPALMLAAASKIPIDADELAVAGAWQGAPLRVVPAKSVPLVVPADAELVIEGEVLPKLREEEGP